jgi:hypothetical protein
MMAHAFAFLTPLSPTLVRWSQHPDVYSQSAQMAGTKKHFANVLPFMYSTVSVWYKMMPPITSIELKHLARHQVSLVHCVCISMAGRNQSQAA